jgi:transposase
MSKATTTSKVDYFRLPRPLWRKLKKHLTRKKRDKSKQGGRPRVPDRAVANAIWYVLCGRDANGKPYIAIGLGSPQASSTSVSRDGGAWVCLRSF